MHFCFLLFSPSSCSVNFLSPFFIIKSIIDGYKWLIYYMVFLLLVFFLCFVQFLVISSYSNILGQTFSRPHPSEFILDFTLLNTTIIIIQFLESITNLFLVTNGDYLVSASDRLYWCKYNYLARKIYTYIIFSYCFSLRKS